MTTTFYIPNEADAPVVPGQAEPDSVDFKVIAAGSNLEGVLTGCAVTQRGAGANMSVDVAAGTGLYQSVTTVTIAGGNVVITAADPTLPRYDLIYFDGAGAVGVIDGTPFSTPVFPTVPANRVILAAVYVPALAASIVNADIIDKRVTLTLPIHTILSAMHSDTLAAAIVRGDVLVGNSTPKLARVPAGAAGSVFYGDGTDSAWTINPKIAGYVRAGSASVPLNITAGDTTVMRFVLGTDVALAQGDAAGYAAWFNTVAQDFTGTPNTNAAAVRINAATAAVAGINADVRALQVIMTDQSASGTQARISAMRFRAAKTGASTTTNIHAVGGEITTTAGLIGTASVFRAFAPQITAGKTVTNFIGIAIENQGTADVTNAIGVDISAQSGATALNFGIRNAGNSVQTGYGRVGAVTAPTNVTDGDFTVIRLFVNNDSNFSLALVSSNPRFTRDSNDYEEYDRAGNKFVWTIGSVVKLSLSGSSMDVGVDGSAPQLVLAAQDGVNEGGQLVLNGAAANLDWTIDNSTGTIRFTESGLVDLDLSAAVAGTAQLTLGNATNRGSLYLVGNGVDPGRIVIEGNGAEADWIVDAYGSQVRIMSILGTEYNHFAAAGSRVLGYQRVGSLSAPTNVTAGDLTVVRLKVGDGAFGTGVEFSVTGDGALSGFLRVGSETAPTDTAAGGLTVTRISIEDAAHVQNSFITLSKTYSDTLSKLLLLQPIFAPASNGKTGDTIYINAVVTPTASSTSSASAVNANLNSTSTFNVGSLIGVGSSASHSSTGTAAAVYGADLIGFVAGSGGAVTNIRGARIRFGISGASVTATQPTTQGIELTLLGGGSTVQLTTVNIIDILAPTGYTSVTTTTLRGINIANLGAAGTITTLVAVDIAAQTGGLGIRNASNIRQTGYASFQGNLSAPSNVADGDTTVARLFVGATGSVTSNAVVMVAGGTSGSLFQGYGRFGSLSNPTNVASGDLTADGILTVANNGLTTDDQFFLSALAVTSPGITFDVADQLYFDRTNNIFNFGIASTLYFTLAVSQAVLGSTTVIHTGDTRMGGYAQVGSASAPTNTTAGDLTCVRLAVQDGTALSATAGEFVRFAGTMTDTATGAKVFFLANPSISPASDTAAGTDFRVFYMQTLLTDSGGAIPGLVNALYAENRDRNSKAIGTLYGVKSVAMVFDSSSPATVGTVTSASALYGQVYTRPTGTSAGTLTTGRGLDLTDLVHSNSLTITDLYGIDIANPGGNALTNMYGINIDALTRGSGLNIGIKNASNYRGTGYLSLQGATTTPAATTDGDFIAKRANLGNNSAFAVSGVTQVQFSNDADYTSDGGQVDFRPNKSATAGQATTAVGLDVQAADKSTSGTQVAFRVIRAVGYRQGAAAGTEFSLFEGLFSQTTVGVGTLTDLFYFRANPSTINQGTISNTYGLRIENLGGTNRTNVFAIDIVAQSAAATLNRGIRNASNSVQTQYARFGSTTTPTAVNDGDVTVVRMNVGNVAFTTSANEGMLVGNLSSVVPTASVDSSISHVSISFAPDTAAISEHSGFRSEVFVDPTANTPQDFFGVWGTAKHSSGNFTTDRLIGVQGTMWQAAAGTVTFAAAVRGTVRATAGTITTGRAFEARIGVASESGTITTLNAYDIVISAAPTATTFVGLNIPNLGGASITNAIGVDIAAQSGAVTLNIGLRNAGKTVYTPSAQQSIAVSAPIVANATIVQISTTTAANMTATPTIADGSDGQILIIINTGTNTFTLQDQGTLASSNLRLVGTTFACATRDNITLMYNAAIGDWVEIARSNVT